MSPPLPGPVGVFDRAAETYDAVGVPFFGPIAAGLVDELAPQPGERALDVGCGRGAVLAPLARRVGLAGRAVGIDLAPGMVRRTAADLAHLGQVEVRLDDAQEPSLPARSFDLVASSLVVFFLADPGSALARWRQLLVPGGRLGVTTFGGTDPRWEAVDAAFLPFLPDRLRADPEAEDPSGSDEGMEALLTEAGLVDVRTATRTVDVRFRDVDQLLAFTWSHGQRAWWEAVAESDRDDLRRAITTTLAAGGDRAEIVLFQQVRHTLGRRPR